MQKNYGFKRTCNDDNGTRRKQQKQLITFSRVYILYLVVTIPADHIGLLLRSVPVKKITARTGKARVILVSVVSV